MRGIVKLIARRKINGFDKTKKQIFEPGGNSENGIKGSGGQANSIGHTNIGAKG
jgi:hypothetical protein